MRFHLLSAVLVFATVAGAAGVSEAQEQALTWTAELGGPTYVHERDKVELSLHVQNKGDAEKVIDVAMTVSDYFGDVLQTSTPPALTVAAGGEAPEALPV